MLYLLTSLKDLWSPLNVFTYITFRTGGAFLTALMIVLLFGGWFLRLVKSHEITQTVRLEGPQSHLPKSGTPTMGGLLILAALVISTVLWAKLSNRFILLTLGSAVFLGILGLFDDYRKLVLHQSSKGMSQAAKLTFQLIWGLAVIGYLYIDPPNPQYRSFVQIPYLKEVFLDLRGLIILFGIIVVIGASNAVNLTDGLDGLACGTLLISALTYGIFAYLAGHARLSSYLRLVQVPGAGELTIYLGAMAGACLGFLWYNGYPASIFMGDTGSLFLGGTIGLIAVCLRQELIMVVVGGIFVAEAGSVLLQVASFRFFKRRIFRMSPLHHHFELLGWPETKVTLRFWIIAVVLALVAMTSLKLR
ncbi:MAG: phospho-N-acetylmuramoyl-pentapeptide-transferase [Elusimicrobia bacterium]|nr:phospho-N-acetylmuramoyl-pentapeptide-transferase [Candidatus Obscuribacterium magneticum]